jgi:hypothetical protein
MVTADSDNYATVDITGARNAAFIRERMFTKVRSLSGYFCVLLIPSLSYVFLTRISPNTRYIVPKLTILQLEMYSLMSNCSASAVSRVTQEAL